MSEKLSLTYEDLLKRLKTEMGGVEKRLRQKRLELPDPDILWVGNKTIFRNFLQYPQLLRREADRLLMYLAKELATAASMEGERAIFMGRKDRQSFAVLLNRYLSEMVECPVCGSPDTRLERSKRLQFLVCEACGTRSPTGQR